MATESIAQPKSGFEVDGTSPLRFHSERGAGERFLTHIGQESIAAELRNSQADPIHRNTVAEHQGAKRSAPIDQNPIGSFLNVTHSPHQSCEHGVLPARCAP
jgi:hypothetical protein